VSGFGTSDNYRVQRAKLVSMEQLYGSSSKISVDGATFKFGEQIQTGWSKNSIW